MTNRLVLAAVFLCSCLPARSSASESVLFREAFDTLPLFIRSMGEAGSAYFRSQNGALAMIYSSEPTSLPSGIEYTLPAAARDPDERRIDMSFGGGGTEVSNSFFVCYAISPGEGLSLPPFGYGPASNSLTGRRTGYIIRFLRHGDGTNEIIFYRNDTGWTKPLKREWISSNPVSSLRRAVIRHRRDGEHILTATFDTGTRFERTFRFQDETYPPTRRSQYVQAIAKAHGTITTTLHFMLDTWTVRDAMHPSAYIRHPSDCGEPVLDSRFRGNDGDDALLADTCERLGLQAMSMENYSDAHRLFMQSLNIRTRLLGDSCPLVADILIHLAALHGILYPKDAERMYGRALAIRENSFGTASIEAARSRADIASFYETQIRNLEATRMWERALDMMKKIGGAADTDMAAGLVNLGKNLMDQSRHGEAAALFERSYEIRKRLFGSLHPDVGAAMYYLERTYTKLGRYEDAEKLYPKIIAIMEKESGPDHPNIAEQLHKWGGLHQKRGQYAQAEKLYLRALSILERAKGPEHIDLAGILNDLGILYDFWDKLTNLEAIYQRSLAIHEKAMGRDDPDLARILSNTASLYYRLGRNDESERMCRRALSLWEKAYGLADPRVKSLCRNLSNIYRQMGRPMEAEYYAERAK